LHVTGQKSQYLRNNIFHLQRLGEGYSLKESKTSLEDVFIYYMNKQLESK
jgi:hypothetical protein